MVTYSFAAEAKEIFKRAELSALIDYLDSKTVHILHGHKLDEIDRIYFHQEFDKATEDLDPKILEDLVMLRIYFNNCIGGSIKVSAEHQIQFDIIVKRFQEYTQNAIARRIRTHGPNQSF
ncbi:MAG: hypothetical protein RR877_00595 [Aurantimicrobium sp.]|uniref:hypothetical protein n=1 Tax=Aurantimicrobium sp. TaxID=1930784 RepID=UPI002FC601F2